MHLNGSSSNVSPVVFVSLGPGDPELLTVKALNTLRAADIIFVPATQADKATPLTSRAADIVRHWNIEETLRLYPIPMLHQRIDAISAYSSMCEEIANLHGSGSRVVVAVEGDVSIYASIHYLLEKLQAMGIATEQQPGITSFIGAAATAQLSLVSQREHLTVIPGYTTSCELDNLLNQRHTLVIMKLSRQQDLLKSYLSQRPQLVCHYFENISTPRAFHTSNRSSILARPFPYFSLMILHA